jgi:hypothetical protein
MMRDRFTYASQLALVALLGGCDLLDDDCNDTADDSAESAAGGPEEGPWTGAVSGLVGGPCADDAYDPGQVMSFTVVETAADGFDLSTDGYATWCSLSGTSFACDAAQVQVAGDAADATILRKFVLSGELSTADDMSGEVVFETSCAGAGCATNAACALTWSFSAQESS